MVEITGDEKLIFWLMTVLVGGVTWVLTYLGASIPSNFVKAPRWVLILCGIRRGDQVDHKKIGLQIAGVSLIVWSTIVTILVPNEAARYNLFGIGFALDVVGLFLFETIKTKLMYNRSTRNR